MGLRLLDISHLGFNTMDGTWGSRSCKLARDSNKGELSSLASYMENTLGNRAVHIGPYNIKDSTCRTIDTIVVSSYFTRKHYLKTLDPDFFYHYFPSLKSFLSSFFFFSSMAHQLHLTSQEKPIFQYFSSELPVSTCLYTIVAIAITIKKIEYFESHYCYDQSYC
jgi:hypothetical protein